MDSLTGGYSLSCGLKTKTGIGHRLTARGKDGRARLQPCRKARKKIGALAPEVNDVQAAARSHVATSLVPISFTGSGLPFALSSHSMSGRNLFPLPALILLSFFLTACGGSSNSTPPPPPPPPPTLTLTTVVSG